VDTDPLDQLKDWAVAAERRAQRAHRLSVTARLPGRVGRFLRRLIVPVLVCGVLAVGVGWYLNTHRSPATADPFAGRPYPTAAPPSGVFATSGVGASAGPPRSPFAGTPAERFVEGAAGFALPPATALGTFSAAQVTEHLEHLQQILVARYLDRRALVDHDPSAILALVPPDARADFRAAYADPAAHSWGVLLSPAAKPAADQPRVDGRTTIRAATGDEGRPVLEIITNYVVVYPFDVPDTGPGSRVAIRHETSVWWVYRPDTVRAGSLGLWPHDTDWYASNIDCGESRKGLLAPYLGNGAHPRASREPDAAYYDPDHALDIGNDCT
jgi:hypothetical protein